MRSWQIPDFDFYIFIHDSIFVNIYFENFLQKSLKLEGASISPLD